MGDFSDREGYKHFKMSGSRRTQGGASPSVAGKEGKLVSGFIIMGVQNFWIHIFMVWSLSTTLQLIINLLTDLNSPFEGIWVVEKNHYHGIIGSIENVITNE